MTSQEKFEQAILKKPASFTLLNGNDYVNALIKDFSQAKKRILICAMTFLQGTKLGAIAAELARAAKRGVDVHVQLDIYFATRFPYMDLPAAERRLRVKKSLALLDELQKHGVRVSHFGKIGANPFKGRCHVKVSVADNNCFSFGGFNLREEGFADADYMLHTRNPIIADLLSQLADRINTRKPPLPDKEITLDSTAAILFDGGRQKHSIIYDRACQLATRAAKIYAVSQYVPGGKLAYILRAKPNETYYNRPEQFSNPTSWAQAFDEQKYRMRNNYTRKRFVHAKFMLFEMPNGERHLITGSNNFSYRGVAFGTQEIALQSTDPHLWQQLYEFLDKNIK